MKLAALLIIILLAPTLVALGQSKNRHESIQETSVVSRRILVTDAKTREAIPFASVQVYNKKQILCGTKTDFDGIAKILLSLEGKLSIHVSSVGYKRQNIGVTQNLLKLDTVKIQLIEDSGGRHTIEVVEVHYKRPILPPLDGSMKNMKTAESIPDSRAPNINSIIASGSHVVAADMGGALSVRGTGNTSQYMNNGIHPREPQSSDEFKTRISNKWIEAKAENTSTFSADVDVASYAFCRSIIDNNDLPSSDAVRVEEFINAMTYDYPNPENGEIIALNHSVLKAPWSKNTHLVRVGLKTKEVALEKIPACNLVFLIDVSGSMSHYNKLDYVKESLSMLTKKLRKQDIVSIVVYAGAAGLVLDGVSGNKKDVILSSLERLVSGGSTAGGAGIELAYATAGEHFIKDGINRVILCTDGDFNVGVSSEGGLEELIAAKRKRNIFLSVLGYGMGNYKDNLLETLSSKGNGNYAYINTLEEAHKVLVKEMAGTLMTLAKDCKFQIAFDTSLVEEYKLIGYENRLLANEDFANDKKDAGEIGAGKAVTLFYEIRLKEEALGDLSSKELASLSVRYKLPNEETSTLRTHAITTEKSLDQKLSPNTVLATAAAAFALNLQGEISDKDLSLSQIIALLKNHNLQKTEDGATLITYLEKSEVLRKRLAAASRDRD